MLSHTPRIPITPLTDLQWLALLPYVESRSPQGRPLHDLRGRMDAIFALIATDAPWRELPAQYGKPDSISRHYRRLTHRGLWETLLHALADASPGHPLRELEPILCRCARRSYRIRGLRLILAARRLGIYRALPGPSWLLPDPDLSEAVHEIAIWGLQNRRGFIQRWGKTLRRVLTVAIGRRRLSRDLRLLAA